MPVEVRDLVLALLSVRVHRTELEDPEGAAGGAHPHLPKEDGARRVDLDHQREQCEDRREDDERQAS